MAGARIVLGVAVVLAALIAGLVVLRSVYDAGLHGVDELIEAHGDAVAAERVHGVDEHGIAHHADLETLEILDRLDRVLAVVDVAGPAIHPAQANEHGGNMVEKLLEHLV